MATLSLLLLGAVLLRLPHINDSLWFDEVWRTRVALVGDSLWYVLFHDTHPPLFALILWGWIAVIGDSEIAVRIPALLCGLASIGVTVVLAGRWFGSRTAIVAGALLALSPAHIWYSHENKNNMLLVFLTVAAVCSLDRAAHDDRRRDWCLFVVAAVLSVWTNLFAIWIVSASCGWLWCQAVGRHRRVELRRALTATLVLGAAVAPLAVWDLTRLEGLQGKSYLRPFTLAEAYKLLLVYLSHGNTLRTISPYAPFQSLLLQPPGFFLVDAFFAGLLLSGLLAVWRRRSSDPLAITLLLSYFFVPLVGVWCASWIYPPIYIERSMLIVLPPYVMLLAAGLGGLRPRALRAVALIAVGVLNGYALFNLWIAKADTWTVYKPKNDWRATAHYFEGEMRDARSPLLIFATAPISVLVYYDGRFAEVFDADAAAHPGARALIKYVAAREPQVVTDRLRRQRADTCYVIADLYWKNGVDRLLGALRGDPAFRLLGEQSFRGVTVFKFRFLSRSDR